MFKRTTTYLIEKIIKHRAFVLAMLVLGLLLAALTFLYYYFYQPTNDIAEIYTLKGKVNFSIIDDQLFSEIYSEMRTKTELPLISLDNIKSPF
ncbi:MAG: hypothetical protein WCV41_01325 [Patescibacteria group bacterium]